MKFATPLRASLAAALTISLVSCGGGGGGSSTVATDPDTAALNTAMNSGNASRISLPVLMSAARSELTTQASAYVTTKQALFGLNADGSANAGSVAGIDWNPTHDSVFLT